MGAPFEATSWDGITGAVFVGYGGAEWIWVAISLLCVVIAMIGGSMHEKEAYDAVDNGQK